MKCNLRPGDMVAIALPTCLEYSITTLAVNLCGGASTLINPSQTICKTIQILKRTHLSLVYLKRLLFLFVFLCSRTETLRSIVPTYSMVCNRKFSRKIQTTLPGCLEKANDDHFRFNQSFGCWIRLG